MPSSPLGQVETVTRHCIVSARFKKAKNKENKHIGNVYIIRGMRRRLNSSVPNGCMKKNTLL